MEVLCRGLALAAQTVVKGCIILGGHVHFCVGLYMEFIENFTLHNIYTAEI